MTIPELAQALRNLMPRDVLSAACRAASDASLYGIAADPAERFLRDALFSAVMPPARPNAPDMTLKSL